MKKVFVTGDRGYIGAVLIPKLLKQGYEVVGYDIGYADSDSIISENLNYKKITKDIRDIEKSDLDTCDAVIHLSGLSNDPIGEINPELTRKINYEATIKLAALAKKAGIKRFIFSSSCSVYGIAKDGIVDEKSDSNPLTAYAKSKLLAEEELKELSDDNFCVILMRNATVYGFSPKFRNDLVVNNLTTSALALNQIKIMSDGTPWRPLIDVRDLADIFIQFLTVDCKNVNGELINIGFNDSNYTVKDIVDKISKELPSAEVVYTGEHGSDSRSYRVKFDKLKSIIPDLKQEWALDKSIKHLIKKLREVGYDEEDFESGKYVRINTLKKMMSEGKIDNSLRISNSI